MKKKRNKITIIFHDLLNEINQEFFTADYSKTSCHSQLNRIFFSNLEDLPNKENKEMKKEKEGRVRVEKRERREKGKESEKRKEEKKKR
jgi:hypothetical protein